LSLSYPFVYYIFKGGSFNKAERDDKYICLWITQRAQSLFIKARFSINIKGLLILPVIIFLGNFDVVL